MKNLIFYLALLIISASSCSKSNQLEEAPKYHIKVEAYSATLTHMTIFNEKDGYFNGNIANEFDAKSSNINVSLHSDSASNKSITIYVNGQVVAHRGGTCPQNDYELQYEL